MQTRENAASTLSPPPAAVLPTPPNQWLKEEEDGESMASTTTTPVANGGGGELQQDQLGYVDEAAAALSADWKRYEKMTESLSWTDQIDLYEEMAAAAHYPGRMVHLQEKLSSLSRKKEPKEAFKRHEEKEGKGRERRVARERSRKQRGAKTTIPYCALCQSREHWADGGCQQYETPTQRRERFIELKLCFRCAKPHPGGIQACTSTWNCGAKLKHGRCTKRHHQSLHGYYSKCAPAGMEEKGSPSPTLTEIEQRIMGWEIALGRKTVDSRWREKLAAVEDPVSTALPGRLSKMSLNEGHQEESESEVKWKEAAAAPVGAGRGLLS